MVFVSDLLKRIFLGVIVVARKKKMPFSGVTRYTKTGKKKKKKKKLEAIGYTQGPL